MTPTTEYALCLCGERMEPGGACKITQSETHTGDLFPRSTKSLCGEYEEGRNCHDCNSAPGQVHHVGCDNEPCAKCGGQAMCCNC